MRSYVEVLATLKALCPRPLFVDHSWLRRTRNAPDGQRLTTSSMASALAALMSTHGRRRGLNTAASPRAQTPLCWQMDGRHSTVSSRVEYSCSSSAPPCSPSLLTDVSP